MDNDRITKLEQDISDIKDLIQGFDDKLSQSINISNSLMDEIKSITEDLASYISSTIKDSIENETKSILEIAQYNNAILTEQIKATEEKLIDYVTNMVSYELDSKLRDLLEAIKFNAIENKHKNEEVENFTCDQIINILDNFKKKGFSNKKVGELSNINNISTYKTGKKLFSQVQTEKLLKLTKEYNITIK